MCKVCMRLKAPYTRCRLFTCDLTAIGRSNCLQQKFQHAEYFTFEYSANFQRILKRFSQLNQDFHKLSFEYSYVLNHYSIE